MIKRRFIAAAWVALVLGACADKVPQSQAAKRVGDVPKQVVDKAITDTAKAMKQGAGRNREPE